MLTRLMILFVAVRLDTKELAAKLVSILTISMLSSQPLAIFFNYI